MIRGAVTKLNPDTCRLAPTSVGIFADECADLIGSIKAQGQIHPIIVRPTKPGDTHPYEIVCGVRRHFAVRYLRDNVDAEPSRTLLAHIRPLSNAEAFTTADQDNRHRRDISDYQRAIDYAAALPEHFAGSQASMAQKLHIPAPALSRYLSLAALPTILFEAFGEPNCVTITHVCKLAPCLKDEARNQRLLAQAAKLAKQQYNRIVADTPYLPPATVLRRLLEAACPPAPIPTHKIRDKFGVTVAVAVGRRRPNGDVSITARAGFPTQPADAVLEILTHLYDPGKGCNLQHLTIAQRNISANLRELKQELLS